MVVVSRFRWAVVVSLICDRLFTKLWRFVKLGFMLDQILEYAEGLYSKALKSMENEEFRKADIYSLSAHSAASFVAAQKNQPKVMRDKAIDLEDASWQLSRQAYAAIRAKLIEPRLSGSEYDEEEEVRNGIYEMAVKVSGRKRRR